MDNHTIDKLLRSHNKTKKRFVGVFASDTLPNSDEIKDTDCFYVVNLDAIKDPGSHWVVVHSCLNDINEYFDSYGWHSKNKSITSFMRKHYIYCDKQVQDDRSTVCGQWCIFFIWQRCKGKTMKDIINLFSKSTPLVNDVMINAAVEKEFKTDQKVLDNKFLSKQMRSVKQAETKKKYAQ